MLDINFADIDSYAVSIEKLVNTICRTIQGINRLCNDTWRYVVDTRTHLYDDARSNLYHSIKLDGYSRRRKFVTVSANDNGKAGSYTP